MSKGFLCDRYRDHMKTMAMSAYVFCQYINNLKQILQASADPGNLYLKFCELSSIRADKLCRNGFFMMRCDANALAIDAVQFDCSRCW